MMRMASSRTSAAACDNRTLTSLVTTPSGLLPDRVSRGPGFARPCSKVLKDLNFCPCHHQQTLQRAPSDSTRVNAAENVRTWSGLPLAWCIVDDDGAEEEEEEEAKGCEKVYRWRWR